MNEYTIFLLSIAVGFVVSIPLMVWNYTWEDYLKNMDKELSTAEIFHRAGVNK